MFYNTRGSYTKLMLNKTNFIQNFNSNYQNIVLTVTEYGSSRLIAPYAALYVGNYSAVAVEEI